MTMIGIISLAGIVVNNAIVLIDYINLIIERKKEELKLNSIKELSPIELMECVIEGGKTRLRPVLLTAITTILGLVPMVFEMTILFSKRTVLIGAPSSQWWTDLSSTIAGGLTFTTALTLLATPALLVVGSKFNITIKKNSKSLIFRRIGS